MIRFKAPTPSDRKPNKPGKTNFTPTIRFAIPQKEGEESVTDVTAVPSILSTATPAPLDARKTPQALPHSSLFPELQPLFQSAYDGTIIADLHGIVLDANARALAFLMYEPGQMPGMNVAQFISGAGETLLASLLESLAERRFALIDAYCVRRNRTQFPAEIAVSTMVTNAQRMLCFMIRDVTKRRATEEMLRLEHCAISNAVNGIATANLRGKIDFVNPAGLRMWGFKSMDEVYGMDFQPFLGNREVAHEIITAVYSGKGWTGECEVNRLDNSKFNVQISAAGNHNADNEFAGMVFSFMDITDRKQAEEARHQAHLDLGKANLSLAESLAESRRLADLANEANRAKSEFLANMSHEIRTPMNAIIGFSEIMAQSIKDPKALGHIDAIRGASKSLLRLINDILDLSKVESGKMRVTPTIFTIETLMREVIETFTSKADSKGIYLVITLAPDLPKAAVLDENRLRQILLNLVGNAIKFTQTGRVELSAKAQFPDDDPSRFRLLVQVIDTGIGIPDDQKEAVFAAFEQRQGQDHAEYGGTGLGLTICRRLAELMEGTVQVSDNPEGRGTIFTLALERVPVAAGFHECVKSTDDPVDQIHFGKATVLIVDDIAVNRDLLRSYMEECPFEFLEAGNGQEAMDCARNLRPDLILADIKMPVMDGVEMLNAIRADASMKNTPVVAVTASLMSQRTVEYRKKFNGFLQKPLMRQDLLRELARFLPHTVDNAPAPTAEIAKIDNAHIRDLPGLAHALRNELDGDFQNIRKSMRNQLLLEFGRRVAALGNTHDAAPVEQAGNELAAAVKAFNIGKIRAALDAFPVLVAQIEQTAAASSINGKAHPPA